MSPIFLCNGCVTNLLNFHAYNLFFQQVAQLLAFLTLDWNVYIFE